MQSSGIRSRQGCLTCRRRHRKCDEGKPKCQMCQKTDRQCEYGSGIRWPTVNQPNYLRSDHVAKIRSTAAESSRARLTATAVRGNSVPHSYWNHPAPAGSSSTSFGHSVCDHALFQGMELEMGSRIWDASPRGLQIDIQPTSDGIDETWNDSFFNQSYFGPIDSTLKNKDHPIALGEEVPWHVNDTPGDEAYSTVVAHPQESQLGEISRNDSVAIACQFGPSLSATFETSSEEVAFNHYLNDASLRIPALDGPMNPYRRLCLVAISYPLLLHTIFYVSTVSMHRLGEADGKAVKHHRGRASMLLQNATEVLKSQKEHGPGWMDQHQSLSVLSLREITLAAYLLNIVAEVMMGSQKTEAHLRAAFCLMTELQYVGQLPQGFYARFLVQRFAMIDVVLSFLRWHRPLAPQNFVLYQPLEEADEQAPSFRELTGCPQRVLSFLARISILADNINVDDDMRMAEAYRLDSEMRIWGALRYPDPVSSLVSNLNLQYVTHGDDTAREEETGNMQLNVLNECFYWLAHLLLARRVFQDPTASPRVQLYRRHLFNLMDRLPAGCGPDSSLPFPFYMAAREAISPQDQNWVHQKHAEMLSKYPDQSRELMMRLTEEIWKQNGRDFILMSQDIVATPGLVNCDAYIKILDSKATHFLF